MQDDIEAPVALAEEQLIITKVTRATGSVRLSTHVEEHLARVDETLSRTDVQMERVPVNLVVDAVPEIRTEGDTLVYPIVEDEHVKQLVLRDEVRITRRVRAEPFSQDVVLRRVRADVEQVAASPTTEHPPRNPEGSST